MSTAAPYNFSVDRGSDWSKVLTLADNNGDPVPIIDIFTTAVSISGTTSPSVTAVSLTYVSTDLWTSNGSASVPGSGTWIRVRRTAGAWEITKWVNGTQVTGYWTSDTNPNHPAWVESWTGASGATGNPEVDSAGMFFEGSISLQERGPDLVPFEFTTVGDGTDGQVTISLSRSYTRSLATNGVYRFDWFMYRGRKRHRLVAGTVTARGSSTGVATGLPVPAFGSSPTVPWGNITGTLSNQTDLQAAIDAAGGGATAYADLTDKASVDLPVVNTPLATALSGKAATSHTHTASQISDSTATGRALLTATDAAAARTTIGATLTGSALITATNAADARSNALGSGATGDQLFTAATPSAARTTLGVRTFTKPSDESRSSTTTYAVDSHLKDIPLEAGKSYKIEFFLAAYLPLTEGGKARLVVPLAAGTVPNGTGFHATPAWGNGNATQIGQTTSGSVRYFQLAASAGYNQNRPNSGVAYTGVLSASGVLSLEWAQNTSGANATIMLGGSIITVTEL